MTKTHLLRAAAALLVTTFLFAACGDDDDNGQPPPGTGGTGGTATGGNGTGGATTGGGPGLGGNGGEGGQTQQDLVDTAEAAGNFTTLLTLLEQAGLEETLRGEGPFTVFAPTDEAFEQFEQDNPGVLDDLDDAAVSNVLRYHVVSGRVFADDLEDEQEVPTLADGNPTLTVNLNDEVTLTDGSDDTRDAEVVTTDVEASNGVIHIIDYVLLPPSG